MKNDKAKEDALWKASFLLLADQVEKNHIWEHGVGDQYKEVTGRLIIYHTRQILSSDTSVEYEVAFNKKLMSSIGEVLGLGFYIYCADLVAVQHKFDSNFEVVIPEDPGLKAYLIKEIEAVEDGGKVRDAIEPPSYAFDTIKNWFFWWVKNVIENDTAFQGLQSETQKEFYLTKLTWLIASGYMLASLAERHHNIWLANNQKVGG
jgi:hypothetical protein